MRSSVSLTIADHPLLALGVFGVELPVPLEQLPSPPWLVAGLRLDAPAPISRDEQVRGAVRDLLRHGGYKPTGRGKPASEYLLRVAGEGGLGTINSLVDACNVVSLHSGLPISIVDLDRTAPPLAVRVAGAEAYVFNASGQTIDVEGLLCLHDAQGPCANAVKDSQRTKTHAGTRAALVVVWGHVAHADRTAVATSWYRELLDRLGATTFDVAM